jgi:hypothetical protein
MTILACVAGIVIGLLLIFAKDFVWQLTQFRNETQGVASDRTDTWDTTTTIGGIALALLSVIVLVISVRG